MSKPLLTVEVRLEHDVVLARQRARQVAGLLGFEVQDQTRIATAVSEIARNAFQYAGGGKVEFLLDDRSRPAFLIRVGDRGPGVTDLPAILDGRYTSPTGLGLGLVGARSLMDRFEIESTPGAGTTVVFAKLLPARIPPPTAATIARVGDELARQAPQTAFDEVRAQNQELLRALEQLGQRETQLTQVNKELEETNRGVLALYAELDEKAEYLKRASEMKSRFLSDMSHEFRTPLNSIRSLANILLDRIDGELTAEQDKQVSFIRKAAEDLTEMVNDLLDMAKVEAGKVTVRTQPFTVSALFGALRGLLRPLLPAAGNVALVFEEPTGILPLDSDEGKISQILRNLVSNALKFTEQGEVRIRAAAGPHDTVLFTVQDTGIGIAPDDQKTIFQDFTQIDSPRQRGVKGTGLGLPLSRKLAELLGGSVTVRSEAGAGSTFLVTLPRVYDESAGADARTLPGPKGDRLHSLPRQTPHVKVLLIDDDEVSRYLLRTLLADANFLLFEAATGAEGLQLAQREKPQAVFLDLDLPDMTGFDVLRRLKAVEETRQTPVIIRTSRVLEAGDRESLRAEVTAILSKEWSSNEATLDGLREALAAAGLRHPGTEAVHG